jgi:hypothetical protein
MGILFGDVIDSKKASVARPGGPRDPTRGRPPRPGERPRSTSRRLTRSVIRAAGRAVGAQFVIF